MRKFVSIFLFVLILVFGVFAEDVSYLEENGVEVVGFYEHTGDQINITEPAANYLIGLDGKRVSFLNDRESLEPGMLRNQEYIMTRDYPHSEVFYVFNEGCGFYIQEPETYSLNLGSSLERFNICYNVVQNFGYISVILAGLLTLFTWFLAKKAYIHYLLNRSKDITDRESALIFLDAEREALNNHYVKSFRKLRRLKKLKLENG